LNEQNLKAIIAVQAADKYENIIYRCRKQLLVIFYVGFIIVAFLFVLDSGVLYPMFEIGSFKYLCIKSLVKFMVNLDSTKRIIDTYKKCCINVLRMLRNFRENHTPW
jgi:hypothetical protein